jgi:hypothetical protein
MRVANTHTLQFWRATESRGPYGTTERTWTRAGGVVHGDVQHRSQVQGDPGPGTTGQGTWKIYTAPLAVEPEMVVQVLSGPNKSQQLIIEDAYNVRNVLTQITCSAWKGDLDG